MASIERDGNVVYKDPEEKPLSARIPKEDSAWVELTIFGRIVEVDLDTADKAREFASRWQMHMDREWHALRATSAAIMQQFTEQLGKHGVSEDTITKSLNGMCIYEGRDDV